MNGFGIKLNYFLFFWNFEKIFTTCVEISIIFIKLNSEIFWPSNLNFKLATSRSKECDSLDTFRLSYKDNKIMFIILYKHYMLKISEFKNQLLKLRFEIN